MKKSASDKRSAFEDVLRRLLTTPPKPHTEMKIGKRKAVVKREPGKPSPRRGSNEKADKPNDRPETGR